MAYHARALSRRLLHIGTLELASACGSFWTSQRMLSLLWGVTRAFLAGNVLAIPAGPINTELSPTFMAGSVNPQPDLLFHPGQICFERGCPFSNFERDIVLGKKGADLLLLNSCVLLGVNDGL